MASNAKFCTQCASPLPDPNPPFCSECGTAVKPNDVQPTVPSQAMRASGYNENPISSSSKYQLPKKNNTSRTFTPMKLLYIALCLVTIIIFPVGWIAGPVYLFQKQYLSGSILIGISLWPFALVTAISIFVDDPIEDTDSSHKMNIVQAPIEKQRPPLDAEQTKRSDGTSESATKTKNKQFEQREPHSDVVSSPPITLTIPTIALETKISPNLVNPLDTKTYQLPTPTITTSVDLDIETETPPDLENNLPAKTLTLPTPTIAIQRNSINSIAQNRSGIMSNITLYVSSIAHDIPDYDRDDWSHWTDIDRDCQNTRHEVLIDESLVGVVFKDQDKCQVVTGHWIDRYTGAMITNASALDVDHMVPLKNAHDSGAWSWDKSKKKDFANDMSYADHLIAVSSSANRSKGSRGPDQWKPSDKTYWCDYILDWIQIKSKWGLTITNPEWNSIQQMLKTCDNPPKVTAQLPKSSVSSSTKTASPIKDDTVSSTGNVTIASINCTGKPEVLVIRNNGRASQNLSGWRIEDEGAKYSYTFGGGFSIGAGNSISMISGESGVSTTNKIYWNGRPVWNNDGDTAYIFSSSGDLVDQRNCP